MGIQTSLLANESFMLGQDDRNDSDIHILVRRLFKGLVPEILTSFVRSSADEMHIAFRWPGVGSVQTVVR